MNNSKMEEMSLSSGSPSLVDYERSSKRRRSDTSCSSGYQTPGNSSVLGIERETIRLKRELAAVRRQLTQMENTVSEHVEIRERIIKVSENEKDVLKSQLQEARQTIEELEEEVEITRRAQAAAEAEFSRAKARMQLQIAVLVENTKMKDHGIHPRFERTSTSSELEKDDAELRGYVKTEEELMLNEDSSPLPSQSNARNIELDEGRSATPSANSNVLMHEEQETPEANEIPVEKPTEIRPLANDRLSSLDGAIREDLERLSTTPKSGDEEASSPRVPGEDSSPDSGDEAHSPLRKEGKNDEGRATKAQKKGDKLELVDVGKYYSYLVSKRFFDFDWAEEYTRIRGMYVCKKCRLSFPNRQRFEDHAWTRHYKGKFFCPHCPNRSTGLSLRNSLHMHVQTKHPTLYQSEAFRKNMRNLRQTV